MMYSDLGTLFSLPTFFELNYCDFYVILFKGRTAILGGKVCVSFN